GEKFRTLWSGDRSGYKTPSEADLALCGILAFWCQGDAVRIDSLFRQSGMMREKWDERRGEQTYGQKTITKCLKGKVEFYQVPISTPNHQLPPGPSEKGIEILFAYFWDKYLPAFRRGNVLYSGRLGREVKPGEICFAPGRELLK